MTRLQQGELLEAWTNKLRKRCPTFMAEYDCPTPGPSPEVLDRRTAEWERRHAEEIERRIESDTAHFVKHQIGVRYENATLDSYEPVTESQRLALTAIRGHSEGSNRFAENIVAYGPVGSGKDHLVIGLAKLAIREKKTVKWTFGTKLFSEMRDAITEKQPESIIINQLIKPDILILSDPAPPDSDTTAYQRSLLLTVAEERYHNCRPTWVTINATNRKEAEERLGEQTVDRLWIGSSQIFVSGPSGRLKANQ